jgi:hypothetical protein
VAREFAVELKSCIGNTSAAVQSLVMAAAANATAKQQNVLKSQLIMSKTGGIGHMIGNDFGLADEVIVSYFIE